MELGVCSRSATRTPIRGEKKEIDVGIHTLVGYEGSSVREKLPPAGMRDCSGVVEVEAEVGWSIGVERQMDSYS